MEDDHQQPSIPTAINAAAVARYSTPRPGVDAATQQAASSAAASLPLPAQNALAKVQWALLGRPGGHGPDGASLPAKISFSWSAPLIAAGWRRPLVQSDAERLIPEASDPALLSADFEAEYQRQKGREGAERRAAAALGGRPQKDPPSLLNAASRALVALYTPMLLVHSFWVSVEVAIRVLSPVALREFLRWMTADEQARVSSASSTPIAPPPLWRGWMLAFALSCGSLGMTIVHHQFFFRGMNAGFLQRQALVASVHAKMLRVNAAVVSAVSPGHIVNLVSNDVRRFDDAVPFWIFVWAGPLEAAIVLGMVAAVVGPAAAFAGMGVLLCVIPLQASLARLVAGLRRRAAQRVDERMRLMGEAVNGALAAKFLSLEPDLASRVCAARAEEVKASGRMAQIRALNLALQFCAPLIAAFATFSVYAGTHGGTLLPVADVFYVVSLLHLPKLYLCFFSVMAIQSLSELGVTMQRVHRFLSLPEPPPPPNVVSEAAADKGLGGVPPVGTVQLRGADFSWARNGAASAALQSFSCSVVAGKKGKAGAAGEAAATPAASENGAANGSAAAAAGAKKDATTPSAATPESDVELGGAAADQQQQQQGGDAADASAASALAAATAAAAAEGRSTSALTLRGVRLDIKPGELVGVCGEVGAGKSSLLAALLGELQPLPSSSSSPSSQPPSTTATTDDPAAFFDPNGTGPVVRGRVAYCAQVPWVMGATLRENVLFGAPFEERRYLRVLEACALGPDLAQLPAGDQTEIGERGVTLSGGQKARVALARAAYSRPDVALLDDPLSAVDAGVGRALFDRCIAGDGRAAQGDTLEDAAPFARCTRVLVTHQRQYLPRCDRVVVLRGGQVAAVGTWEELSRRDDLPELAQGALEALHLDDGDHGADGANGGGGEEKKKEEEAGVLPPLPPSSSSKPPAAGRIAEEEEDEDDDASTDDDEADSPSSDLPSSDDLGRGPSVVRRASQSRVASFLAALRPAGGASFLRASFAGGGRGRWGANGKAGDDDDDDDDDDDESAGPDGLSRVRTMMPDVNTAAKGARRGAGSKKAAVASRAAATIPAAAAAAAAASASSSTANPWAAATPSLTNGNNGGARSFLFGRGGAVARAGALPAAASAPSVVLAAAKAKEERRATRRHYKAGRLVRAEGRESGSVSWGVYGRYVRAAGLPASVLVAFALVAGQAAALAAEWWLAQWANTSPPQQQAKPIWLSVYGGLTAAVTVLAFGRSSLFFEFTLRASTRLHDAMAWRVLRAPLAFFHVTPSGRLLNRFSSDLGRVDDQLPAALFDVLQTGFVLLGTFVLVAVAVPVVLPVFLPLVAAFWWLRRRYVATSREVKRLEAVTRSPVYASFSATLRGLPTVRAFGAGPRFHLAFARALAQNGAWWHAFIASARWVGFRLDSICTVVAFAAIFLSMAMRASVSVAVLGLALNYVIQLTGALQWWVRQTAEVENCMTSAERLIEYTELAQEGEGGGGGGQGGSERAGARKKANGDPLAASGTSGLAAVPPLDPSWPRTGAVEFRGVSARYRPGLPPVLRGLSFELLPGTSCGLVGRTGSGKSSLMLALFRLIDITRGTILLDGRDTRSVPLRRLRAQLAIIPQEPVFFTGTLRENLDPSRRQSGDDAALERVLEAVQLSRAVAAAGGLSSRMADAGDTYSVGQRQLLCLARALLQGAKVLALDEATANVDRATDALIQGALRDYSRGVHGSGGGHVLLVIAHRVETIMDMDKILLLSKGEKVEEGPPQELALREGGAFSAMVASAKAAAKGGGGNGSGGGLVGGSSKKDD
jgi:ABC-type multidrug transport system fused ATPase/permease subunit